MLAEKISEDDFRVNMGDHKAVGRDKLPPQIVNAALAMQAGQVSGLIQIENAFTIFRLNAHNPPRKQSLARSQDRPANGITEEQVRTAALESGEEPARQSQDRNRVRTLARGVAPEPPVPGVAIRPPKLVSRPGELGCPPFQLSIVLSYLLSISARSRGSYGAAQDGNRIP